MQSEDKVKAAKFCCVKEEYLLIQIVQGQVCCSTASVTWHCLKVCIAVHIWQAPIARGNTARKSAGSGSSSLALYSSTDAASRVDTAPISYRKLSCGAGQGCQSQAALHRQAQETAAQPCATAQPLLRKFVHSLRFFNQCLMVQGRDANRKLQRSIKAGKQRERLPSLVEQLRQVLTQWQMQHRIPFTYGSQDYKASTSPAT